jgi:hypothetical protein
LIEGGFRVLDYGKATALFDSQQACRAVIQVTGENQPHYAAPVAESGRAKERVYGRSMAIFLGTATHTHMAI